MEFIVKSFSELKINELYAILQLRSEVFVVEQDCVYQDLDFKDQLNPLLTFYRIETNQLLEEDNLYCQNLNSLSNNKNIKIKEYQDIDYSSLNNKIKESIKFINDFTILKKNDFILLCDIKINKEKHNEILKNEIIEKKVEEISKNLISDYIIKYNYKKYE